MIPTIRSMGRALAVAAAVFATMQSAASKADTNPLVGAWDCHLDEGAATFPNVRVTVPEERRRFLLGIRRNTSTEAQRLACKANFDRNTVPPVPPRSVGNQPGRGPIPWSDDNAKYCSAPLLGTLVDDGNGVRRFTALYALEELPEKGTDEINLTTIPGTLGPSEHLLFSRGHGVTRASSLPYGAYVIEGGRCTTSPRLPRP